MIWFVSDLWFGCLRELYILDFKNNNGSHGGSHVALTSTYQFHLYFLCHQSFLFVLWCQYHPYVPPRLYHLPFHRYLNTRRKYFHQNLTSWKKKDCKSSKISLTTILQSLLTTGHKLAASSCSLYLSLIGSSKTQNQNHLPFDPRSPFIPFMPIIPGSPCGPWENDVYCEGTV